MVKWVNQDKWVNQVKWINIRYIYLHGKNHQLRRLPFGSVSIRFVVVGFIFHVIRMKKNCVRRSAPSPPTWGLKLKPSYSSEVLFNVQNLLRPRFGFKKIRKLFFYTFQNIAHVLGKKKLPEEKKKNFYHNNNEET